MDRRPSRAAQVNVHCTLCKCLPACCDLSSTWSNTACARETPTLLPRQFCRVCLLQRAHQHCTFLAGGLIRLERARCADLFPAATLHMTALRSSHTAALCQSRRSVGRNTQTQGAATAWAKSRCSLRAAAPSSSSLETSPSTRYAHYCLHLPLSHTTCLLHPRLRLAGAMTAA